MPADVGPAALVERSDVGPLWCGCNAEHANGGEHGLVALARAHLSFTSARSFSTRGRVARSRSERVTGERACLDGVERALCGPYAGLERGMHGPDYLRSILAIGHAAESARRNSSRTGSVKMVSMKISAGFQDQMLQAGRLLCFLVAGSALMVNAPAAEIAAQKPGTVPQGSAQTAETPANQQPAAQPQTQDTAERAAVAGFRSARWGMTEAQVKTAIQKDFNISPDKVQTEENLGERTAVLMVTVDDLLEGVGKARVSYILGYSTKKLIQVNVVWGTTIDPQVKPERIVAGANQLRTLFLSAGYVPETVVSNIPSGSGAITVFQGEDADKHMTVLRLVTSSEASARQKQQRKGNAPDTAVVLLLSYVQDPRNPDVYRLKKGQF